MIVRETQLASSCAVNNQSNGCKVTIRIDTDTFSRDSTDLFLVESTSLRVVPVP